MILTDCILIGVDARCTQRVSDPDERYIVISDNNEKSKTFSSGESCPTVITAAGNAAKNHQLWDHLERTGKKALKELYHEVDGWLGDEVVHKDFGCLLFLAGYSTTDQNFVVHHMENRCLEGAAKCRFKFDSPGAIGAIGSGDRAALHSLNSWKELRKTFTTPEEEYHSAMRHMQLALSFATVDDVCSGGRILIQNITKESVTGILLEGISLFVNLKPIPESSTSPWLIFITKNHYRVVSYFKLDTSLVELGWLPKRKLNTFRNYPSCMGALGGIWPMFMVKFHGLLVDRFFNSCCRMEKQPDIRKIRLDDIEYYVMRLNYNVIAQIDEGKLRLDEYN